MNSTNPVSDAQTAADAPNGLDAAILEALRDVKDPEIPTLSLVDLGMVHRAERMDGYAYVELIPTFVGCPALDFMARDVEKRISRVEGIQHVSVRFVMDIAWTTERITPEGRHHLKNFGIAPPPSDFRPEDAPACPYCGASQTDVVNLFGPTACRAIYYCNHCSQPFEGIKYV